MTCKNCNYEVNHKYCSNCGQPVKLKRVDGSYIRQELGDILNLDKGFFYTAKEVFIRPGKTVRGFLEESRTKLVKPIPFLIITSLIYTLINQYFNIEEQYIHAEITNASTVDSIIRWIQNNYGFTNILMGVFIAFLLKLFFKKYIYNYYETLILLCFIMGNSMLIIAFFSLLQGITSIDLLQFGGVLFIVYILYAITDFYDRRKIINYIKALSAYLLGSIIFFSLAISIGLIIDLLFSK